MRELLADRWFDDPRTIALQNQVKTLRSALAPADRLGAGTVVYRGYAPSNVVDLTHCIGIALEQLLERQKNGGKERTRIRKCKSEIERLMRACDKALRSSEPPKVEA